MAALRVANPPERPLAVFDGDCGFCRQWIERWRSRTGPRVDYAPSQEVAPRFPEIPPEAFARAFQLVLPDGRVLEGAAAVLATLDPAPGDGMLSALARVPGPRRPSRTGVPAGRAPSAGGKCSHAPALGTLGRKAHVFRRERALSPRARPLLPRRVRVALGPGGRAHRRARHSAGRPVSRLGARTDRRRAVLAPADALLDLDASDAFLHLLCGGGVLAALAAGPGAGAGAAAAALCWALYLSLAIAGQVFLQFQWDYAAARGRLARDLPRAAVALAVRAAASRRRRSSLWLLRWLLFRLMFSSGWRQARERRPDVAQPDRPALSLRDAAAAALDRVVPAPVSAVVPDGLGALSLLRRARRSVSLLRSAAAAPLRLPRDGAAAAAHRRDGQLRVLQPARRSRSRSCSSTTSPCRRAGDARPRPRPARRARGRRPSSFRSPCVVLFASSVEFAGTLDRALALPRPVAAAARRLGALSQRQPLRPLRGDDHRAARDPDRGQRRRRRLAAVRVPLEAGRRRAARPRFVAPHQPRLDWQMWFAALGTIDENPWLVQFLGRLLEGSPDVLGLLAANPFPGRTRRATCARRLTTTGSRTPPSAAAPAPGGGASDRAVQPGARAVTPASRKPGESRRGSAGHGENGRRSLRRSTRFASPSRQSRGRWLEWASRRAAVHRG